MRVAMLISAIRKRAPYNLRRIAACITYINKTATKIVRYQCNELELLSTSLPSLATCRIYSTESDKLQVSLPMLVDGRPTLLPFMLIPLRLFYLLGFKVMPHMEFDKEFVKFVDKDIDINEFLKGAKYV